MGVCQSRSVHCRQRTSGGDVGGGGCEWGGAEAALKRSLKLALSLGSLVFLCCYFVWGGGLFVRFLP